MVSTHPLFLTVLCLSSFVRCCFPPYCGRHRPGSQRTGGVTALSVWAATAQPGTLGYRVPRAFWNTQEPETCSQAFVCMGIKSEFWRNIAYCVTSIENQTRLLHDPPPSFKCYTVLSRKKSLSWFMNHDNLYMFVMLYLQYLLIHGINDRHLITL